MILEAVDKEVVERATDKMKEVGNKISEAVQKAHDPQVKEKDAKSVVDFLDRLINRRKGESSMPKFSYPEVKREQSLEELIKAGKGGALGELYEEIMNYGKAHPELQDQYPDFESLADYYMKENDIRVGGNGEHMWVSRKTQLPHMSATETIEEKPLPKQEHIEPIKAEVKGVDVKPISTVEYLDKLIKK